MKNLISIMAVLALLTMAACNSNSKSKTWTAEQKEQWKTECVQMLLEEGITEVAIAKDHCDCMYEKTSEKYTPEESALLTVEQEREIWRECDYSW